MTIRFSDELRSAAEPEWSAATGHRFTRDLAAGTLDRDVYARYLVQDYAFIETLVSFVGFAVGRAPGMEAKKTLAGFLGVLTGEENTFFERSFAALGVDDAVWRGAEPGPVTATLRRLMLETAENEGYAEIMALLLCAEWCYLEWATSCGDGRTGAFFFDEWIELHQVDSFREFVDFLRGELDREGPALDEARRKRMVDLFREVTSLEVAFFDAAYG